MIVFKPRVSAPAVVLVTMELHALNSVFLLPTTLVPETVTVMTAILALVTARVIPVSSDLAALAPVLLASLDLAMKELQEMVSAAATRMPTARFATHNAHVIRLEPRAAMMDALETASALVAPTSMAATVTALVLALASLALMVTPVMVHASVTLVDSVPTVPEFVGVLELERLAMTE